MKAQVAFTLCVLAVIFGTSSSASTKAVATPPNEVLAHTTDPDGFGQVVANVKATYSELLKLISLSADIIFLIPEKGLKLVGVEAMKVVKVIRNGTTDIGGEVKALRELLTSFVMHDLLYDGTASILFIVKTARKTLQAVKKYLDNV